MLPVTSLFYRRARMGRQSSLRSEHGHSGEERMLFKQATHQGKQSGSPASLAPSILSDDLTIEGNIVSEGEVHINGVVKGDVTARKLTLGEEGAITGTVEADDAVVGGKLAGRLTAKYVVLLNT